MENPKKRAEEQPMRELVEKMEREKVERMNTWKSKLYAPELGKGWNELKQELEKARRALEKRFGDNFVSLDLGGSWSKGFPRTSGPIEKRSDVDLGVTLKSLDAGDHEAIREVLKENIKTGVVREHSGSLEKIKESIENLSSKSDTEQIYKVAVHVAGLFANIHFGDEKKLLKARRELLEEVAKSPVSEAMWEQTRKLYSSVVVELLDAGRTMERLHKVQPNYVEGIVKDSLGLSMNEFREVLDAREKSMSLPSLSEMKKKYRVK